MKVFAAAAIAGVTAAQSIEDAALAYAKQVQQQANAMYKLNEALAEAQDALKYSNNLHKEVWDGDHYDEVQTDFEIAMDQAADKLEEWGLDSDVVEQWAETTEGAWTDLMTEQDKQSTEMAQSDIKEAAAYMKPIFDNMIADLKEKTAEAQIEIADELDSQVAEIKDSIDTQSAEGIEEFQNWFYTAYDAVDEATDMSYDDIRNATALNMNRFADLENHFNTVNSLKRRNRKEVIDFVAENSYMNGVSLQAIYGGEWSAWMDSTIDKFDQLEKELKMADLDSLWNLDHSMKRRNKNKNMQSDYSWYYDNAYDNYDDDYVYEEEPTAFEEAMEEAGDKLEESIIEWGFDTEVVDQWLSNKESAWTELMTEQDKQSTEMAQNDTKEAAAYMKGIFDNMVTDLKEKSAEAQVEIADELDSKVAEIKDTIDAQSAENIEEIQHWFDSAYDAVNEATDMSYDEIRNATVGFASVHEGSSESSNFGYGILAIGAAAATAAVLYKKRQQKIAPQAGEADKLLEDDEEFQMV